MSLASRTCLVSLLLLAAPAFASAHACAPKTVLQPQPAPNVQLSAVSAFDSTHVWAVGNAPASSGGAGFAEYYNGAGAAMPVPLDQTGMSARLTGVVAASGSQHDVWAVGQSESGQMLIERNDPSKGFRFVNFSVTAATSQLDAIAATSPSDVWAVGSYAATSSALERVLIVHWDGTQWTQFSVPGIRGQNVSLAGLAAVAPDNAWAVGQALPDGVPYGIHWNGKRWSQSPLIWNPSVGGQLTAVAANAVQAWAVGYSTQFSSPPPTFNYTSMAEQWTGTGWVLTPTPDEGEYDLLAGVATNTVATYAVGSFFGSQQYSGKILQWTASGWVSTPEPDALLLGISAIGKSDAFAIAGLKFIRTGKSHALLQILDCSQGSPQRQGPAPGARLRTHSTIS
jgi:hypothetical protein